jgi:hypothetical protein
VFHMGMGIILILPSGSSTAHNDVDLPKLNWVSELASNKKKHFPAQRVRMGISREHKG